MTASSKILVIEDSETLRDLVSQILRIESYDVRVAVDGEEGLRFAREATPDLILCDISMPKMNGHEVLRAVRSSPATASVPFIFLTARAERADLRAGMELGADDYLTKPFDAEELLSCVRTRLRKHESARTAVQQQSEERQVKMLLNMPHEIRIPLSGILGLAELLIASDFSAEERRSMVNDILASGRRLERTLTNLVLHLELELARQSPERARRFATNTPQSVATALQAAAAAKGAEYSRTVDVVIQSEASLVAMDVLLLQKSVEELLDNAIKFSLPAQPIELKASRSGAEVVIEISDRGTGMTLAQIAELQAFRQIDRARQNQQGLGLGLAIAQDLALLHRGSLALLPRAGGGVTASIRLPLAVQSASE